MNVLPVRVRLGPDEPFAALVKDLQLKHVFTLEHQHVDVRRIEREVGIGDLFDTVVIYQNYPKKLAPFQSSDINVEYLSAQEKRHYRLALSVAQHDGMDMSIEYQTSYFEEEFVLQLAAQLQNVLRTVALHPGSTTSSLMSSFVC
jgi:non-ribosomal peptide synthetase component F